jgi:hypothetical protein
VVALRTSIAVEPLLVSLAFGWLVMQGHLGFGGTENNILLVAPLLLWSRVFLLGKLILWLQGFPFGQSASVSVGLATGLTALTWVVLYVFAWLLPG